MLLVISVRKLIVPQKEPSPLLDKKIEELEAKFADMTDEELEDLGDDDGDGSDAHCMPTLQTQLTSDMDMLHYAPPQVCSMLMLTEKSLFVFADLRLENE